MSKSAKTPFPFEFHQIDENLVKNNPEFKNLILTGPKKFCNRIEYKTVAEDLYNFKVRPDDVWLFGVPRSGTTLAQEIVWLLGNDLNYSKAAENVMDVRFPVFESAIAFQEPYENVLKNPEKFSPEAVKISQKLSVPAWKSLAETSEKRFIKTHLPLSLGPRNILQSGCKIVYVARNPKDVAVSMFNLIKTFGMLDEKFQFDKFWKLFQQGFVFSTPYFEHVKEGWDLRNHENVLFLFYEEYTKDMRKTLLKMSQFLNKPITHEDVNVLLNHLEIDNFRKNKSVNNDHLKEIGIMKKEKDKFIRKGKVGGWKDYFTDELNAEADKWIQENIKTTNIKLPQSY